MKRIFKELELGKLDWYNPLVISGLMTLVLILLHPVELIEYKSSPGKVSVNQVRWFDDLEGDGAPEYFVQKSNTAGNLGIMYYDENRKLEGQENFDSEMAHSHHISKPSSADLNNDGTKDLILYSSKEDSIFLNVFDYASGNALLNHRFITTVGGYNDKTDYSIGFLGAEDVTGDDVPELFFYVVGHFSLYPRRLFRYDYAQDSLIASENTGAGFYKGLFLSGGDSTMIVIPGAGYGNVPPEYPCPYHDSCSWVFAYNAQLELVWKPMPLISPVSHITDVVPYDSGFLFIHRKVENSTSVSVVYSVSLSGEVRARRQYDMIDLARLYTFEFRDKTHYMVYWVPESEKSGLYSRVLDPETLDLRHSRWSKLISDDVYIESVDFNSDGVDEPVVIDIHSQQIKVYNAKRRMICAIPYREPYIYYLSSTYDYEMNQGELTIMNPPRAYTYYFTRNKWYSFRYLVWLGYYLSSFIFVSVIFLIQIRRNQRVYMLEKQITEMYLTNLRNQLDPHFTMNALNTVGSYIYKEEKAKAYDMFQRFSALIRSALITSSQTLWSLSAELQFVENYLELQQMRFPDLFTYSIEVDSGEDISQIKIPRLMVQMCAENSAKHAFEGIDYKGRIQIRVMRTGVDHVVEISDNGIGMDASRRRGSSNGTSMGLGLIEEQVKLTNKLYQTAYSVEIIEEEGQGVTVRLTGLS